jgi:hypothetical protein
MSTGSLLFPIGHVFLDDNGTPVNGGLVGFFRTGTATEQDTYSDSTLSTPNANPVELNSSGRSTTAIYGDPASGYDYRVRLATAADAQIWQYDDIVVDGADTATIAEGSFTATLTGYASGPTGTVNYRIVANSAGTGKVCHLYADSAISGTSNATALTMTGVPAACRPSASKWAMSLVVDESLTSVGGALVGTGGTITFYQALDDQGTGTNRTDISASGFLNSGTKGLPAGWSISYPL